MSNSDVNSSEVNSSEVEEQEFVVSLSREEVLAIVAMLKLGAIPNLGDDPIPDLTPEQRAYGLIVAERGLRARGLAGIDEDGKIRFPNQLLNAVGTCALAERSIFITQMMAPQRMARENRTSQMMVHQNGQGSTVHTPLDGTVHQFAWNQNRESVINQIQSACRFPTNHQSASEEPKAHNANPRFSELAMPDPVDVDLADLSIPIRNGMLKRATDFARDGKAAEATAELTAQDISGKDADRLAAFLSAPHVVTVVQSVTPQIAEQSGNSPGEPTAVAIQSTTFLHNKRQLITAIELEPNNPDLGTDEPSSYRLASATPAEVKYLLEQMLN